MTVTLKRPLPAAPRWSGVERVRCAYLVGADGGRSSVRKRLGVGFEGETFETERMIIGDVRTADLDRDHWHTWADMATRTLRVALCPLPGTDVFQLTAPFTAEEAPEAVPGVLPEDLRRGLRAYGHPLHRRHLDVALPGEHPHGRTVPRRPGLPRRRRRPCPPPAGGQGLNTGVQDAYNLGWKLAGVSAALPERLLDTYEEERLPVAAEVLGISTKLYARAKRGTSEDAHVRDEETQQLLLGYRAARWPPVSAAASAPPTRRSRMAASSTPCAGPTSPCWPSVRPTPRSSRRSTRRTARRCTRTPWSSWAKPVI